MDRATIIRLLERVAVGGGVADPSMAREAAEMLRSDAEYIKSLRKRVFQLRASDKKKAERIEKLAMFVDATLAARHWYEGHPEGALEEIEKRANDLLDVVPDETEQPFGPHDGGRHDLPHDQSYVHTARDAVQKLADKVQQCAADPGTKNPSIYNAALTWQKLEELRAHAIRGCLLAGPGRGDCGHFVGLPEEENRETTDDYGRPHGWCQVCWLVEREGRMCDKVRELTKAALKVLKLDALMEETLVEGSTIQNARDKLLELTGEDASILVDPEIIAGEGTS